MQSARYVLLCCLCALSVSAVGIPPKSPTGDCQNPWGPSDCSYYCGSRSACDECCTNLSGLLKNECLRQCILKWPDAHVDPDLHDVN